MCAGRQANLRGLAGDASPTSLRGASAFGAPALQFGGVGSLRHGIVDLILAKARAAQ